MSSFKRAGDSRDSLFFFDQGMEGQDKGLGMIMLQVNVQNMMHTIAFLAAAAHSLSALSASDYKVARVERHRENRGG